MADDSDYASALEDLQRDIAIKHRKPAAPPFTGRCLNCEEPLETPLRWCDADCTSDWERIRDAAQQRI